MTVLGLLAQCGALFFVILWIGLTDGGPGWSIRGGLERGREGLRKRFPRRVP